MRAQVAHLSPAIRVASGLVTVAAGAVVSFLVAASPAAATYPGQNGPLVAVSPMVPPSCTAIPVDCDKWTRMTVDPATGQVGYSPELRSTGKLVASPDGRRIAYRYGRSIRVARMDGSGARIVTRRGGTPTWRPDGRRLAFSRNGDLYTIRTNGRGLRRLTSRGTDSSPAWSPRGNVLAFVRGSRNRHRRCSAQDVLYTLRASGGKARAVFDPGFGCAHVDSLDWSPTGTRLVIRVEFKMTSGPAVPGLPPIPPGLIGINVIKADGTGRRHISIVDWEYAPVWAPEGQEIAYLSDECRTAANPFGSTVAFCGVTPEASQYRPITERIAFIRRPIELSWFPAPR